MSYDITISDDSITLGIDEFLQDYQPALFDLNYHDAVNCVKATASYEIDVVEFVRKTYLIEDIDSGPNWAETCFYMGNGVEIKSEDIRKLILDIREI